MYLLFPQIESLKFQHTLARYNQSKTFFNNHKQLKKLELVGMNLADLQDFTSKLTNLVETKISFDSFVNFQENVKDFLENHQQLMKAYFYSGSHIFEKTYLRKLLEPFAIEWNIRIFYENNGVHSICHFVLNRK